MHTCATGRSKLICENADLCKSFPVGDTLVLHIAMVLSPVAAEQKYGQVGREAMPITGVEWPVHFPSLAPVVLSTIYIEFPAKRSLASDKELM